LWILSGSDDPWIYRYNRALVEYTDGGVLRGAYGPRIRRWRGRVDQLDHVRRLLRRDPDSRQAVIQVYDPVKDTRGYRDVPCTVSYRFFLRSGRLRMHTTMRSNDVWLGLPYDQLTEFLDAVVAGAPWPGAGPSWSDLVQVLLSYRRWTSGDRPQARALAKVIDGPVGEALRGWYEHLTPAAAAGGGLR